MHTYHGYVQKEPDLHNLYLIKGEPLKQANCVRDLGIHFDCSLGFDEQLQGSLNNMKRNLGMIMRYSRMFTKTTTLQMLYFSLV